MVLEEDRKFIVLQKMAITNFVLHNLPKKILILTNYVYSLSSKLRYHNVSIPVSGSLSIQTLLFHVQLFYVAQTLLAQFLWELVGRYIVFPYIILDRNRLQQCHAVMLNFVKRYLTVKVLQGVKCFSRLYPSQNALPTRGGYWP